MVVDGCVVVVENIIMEDLKAFQFPGSREKIG